MWPFKNKTMPVITGRVTHSLDEPRELSVTNEKAFDWNHYQMTQYDGGYFGDEFSQVISKDTLKTVACKELDVAKAVNAISRQFLGSSFVVMSNDKTQGQFTRNQITETLVKGVYQESSATFHQMRMFDLIVTGESFAWISDNAMSLVSLPSERVERVYEDGSIVKYKYTKKSGQQQFFEKKNIIEWRLPNPFSRHSGMSMLVSLILEILTRKYGKEWTIGFFLRGGSMSSQYHTEQGDASQLARLMATLQQMVGSRRNMHSDKILPKGVMLASPGAPFSSVQIIQLLQSNSRDIYSALGVPPVAVGDTDGVNFASADQQMAFFWQATILPFQAIYTSCLLENDIVKSFFSQGQTLAFDNSRNKYLDEFDSKLKQDVALKSILTIDERRQRLGFEPIGDARGAKLETESAQASPFALSVENKSTEPLGEPMSETEGEPTQDLPSIVKRLVSEAPAGQKEFDFFQSEVSEWEKIVLSLLEDKEQALKTIQGRAHQYGRDYAKTILADVMEMYDAQYSMLQVPQESGSKVFQKGEKEDRLAGFRTRSEQFLEKLVAASAEGRFIGFTETWTARIFTAIQGMMSDNYSLGDIASNLKITFGQYYEGQMKTVVNTEYRSSLQEGTARFGTDLSKVSKKLGKIWMAKIDNATRDTHSGLDGEMISGDSKDVAEMSFVPGITLRYPMDGSAPAEEVINCRCAMRWKVLKWE